MRPWYDRYPDRWEAELHALDEAGWPYQVREPDRSLTVCCPLPSGHTGAEGGSTVALSVVFPPAYPFFPPSVHDRGNTLGLTRHRNPIDGELCLIEPDDWRLDTTVVALLQDQLPRLLAAGGDTAPAPGIEVPGTERLTHHNRYRLGLSAVLVQEDWHVPPTVDQGAIVVGFRDPAPTQYGVACLTRVLGRDLDLAGQHPGLVARFPFTVLGRWTRSANYQPAMTAKALWKDVEPQLAPLEVEDLDPDHPLVNPALVQMIGVLVPAETSYRHRGEDWVFLLRCRVSEKQPWRHELAAAAYVGPHTMFARSPDHTELHTRRALVVGLGALGHHVATDLTRAGFGRLDLVDSDLVDPATSCRQVAPITFTGLPKSAALGLLLGENNPLTDIHCYATRVGGGAHDEVDDRRHEHLEQLARAADLVVDASANPPVTRYLSAFCRAAGTPLLHLSATAGAWGGVVTLLTEETGCWACVEHHRLDGTLPVPPQDPDRQLVVPRCGEPTFTGSNADLASIAHHASRVALHRLAARAPSAGTTSSPPCVTHNSGPSRSAGPRPACRYTPAAHSTITDLRGLRTDPGSPRSPLRPVHAPRTRTLRTPQRKPMPSPTTARHCERGTGGNPTHKEVNRPRSRPRHPTRRARPAATTRRRARPRKEVTPQSASSTSRPAAPGASPPRRRRT